MANIYCDHCNADMFMACDCQWRAEREKLESRVRELESGDVGAMLTEKNKRILDLEDRVRELQQALEGMTFQYEHWCNRAAELEAARDLLAQRVTELEVGDACYTPSGVTEMLKLKKRIEELEADKARLDWLAGKAAEYPPSVFYWTRREIDSRMESECIAAQKLSSRC